MSQKTSAVKPPEGFSYHTPQVIRSRYPDAATFEFVVSHGFSKFISLGSFPTDEERAFVRMCKGKLTHFPLTLDVSRVGEVDKRDYESQLAAVIDEIKKHDPESRVYLYDDDGFTNVGVVCAILRRIEGWDLPSTLSEFFRFFPSRSWSPEHVRMIIEFDISRWR